MKKFKYLLFFLTFPMALSAQTVDWLLPFGSSDFDQIMKLRPLGNDSFAAVGIIDSGLVSVGPVNLSNGQNAFNQASFIIKGDNNGNVSWGISFEARSNINGFEVDNAGNMYIAGNFDGTIDFDPGAGFDTLISDINAGNGDGFLAKFSPSGNLIWKQRLRNLGMDVRDLAIDGAGNVYVAGSNTGTVYTLNIGDTIARGPNAFVTGAFMAKFDAANGSFVWGHSFYPDANSFAAPEISQIEADGSGNVYVLGNTSDTIDINPTGGGTFINAFDFSNERTFLARYSSTASLVWSHAFDLSGPGAARSSAWTMYLKQGMIFISGNLETDLGAYTYSFGTKNGSIPAQRVSFLSRISSGSGAVDRVSMFNTQLEVADFYFANDTLFVSGALEDTVDFDMGAGTAEHRHDGMLYDNDAFVAMYDTAFSYKNHFVFGDSVADGDDMVAGLFLTANSELILAGNYGSINTDFQPGADTNFVGVSQGGPDCFVAKYLIFPPPLSCNISGTGPITGPVDVCVNGKNLVYSIDTVGNSNATNIHWTFTGGPQPVKISGQGTRRVIIDITNDPFTVNVIASNSLCTSQVTSLQVNNPNQLPQLADTIRQRPSCGQSNGALDITVLNPNSPPYTYIWSSGDTLDSLTGLPSGSYTVTVSDSNSCASQMTIELNDLGAPIIDSSSIVNVLCFGDNSGSINIHVSGGAQPYSYFWSNGDTTEDISNLERGGYRVSIQDSLGCKYTEILVVEQAALLGSSLSITQPTICGASDGSVTVSPSGGTSPYSLSWSTGASGTSLTGLSAGGYSYTVTDANNCSIVRNVSVSDNGAPNISLDSLHHESCLDTNGLIATSVSGASGSATYTWSNGQSGLLISGLAAGVYTLSVSDGLCGAVRNFEVEKVAPETFPLCLVTVDDSLERNTIVWQKPYKTNIASFELYRESWLTGAFIKVAESHVDTLSQFIDLVADPKLKAWSYRMKTIDVCGAESAFSDAHKSMHLVMKRDTSGPIELVWNAYEGFPYSTFYIERLTDTAVGWVLIDSVSLPQTTYLDLNAPKQADLLYAIGIDHPTGCQTSRAAPSNYGSVRSNRSINAGENPTIGIEPPDTTGIKSIEVAAWNMRVFPNPTSSKVWVAMDGELQATGLEILDLRGRIVIKKALNAEIESIDVSQLGAGVYLLSFTRGDSQKMTRLVIQ